jgi:protein-tyrosine phosphatase
MDTSPKKIKVLFVCLGNICRSPTAEGVFRHLVEAEGLAEHFDIDSAGTAGYHINDKADRRSEEAAKRRGYDISKHRGRRFEVEDLDDFDYILAMDKSNFSDMSALCTTQWSKLKMFMDFAPESSHREVPDPYYRDEAAFELALDLCEIASRGLLHHIKEKKLSSSVKQHKH